MAELTFDCSISVATSGGDNGSGVDSLNSVTGDITLDGADGIIVLTNGQVITVSGFRTEFVAASGSLQNQINLVEATDVDSITASGTTLTGDITLEAIAGASLHVSGQVITVSGALPSLGVLPFRYKADRNSIIDSDPGNGRLRWNNADLGVATQIFIDVLTDGFGIDITNILDNVATPALLYIQQDDNSANFVSYTVSSINPATGYRKLDIVNIANAGSIGHNNRLAVLLVGNSSSVVDEVEPALVGVDGITIVSGTSTVTVSGFRSEFVAASGSLQTQINNIDSSVTLQDAYDNGTGKISTITGKPVVISGSANPALTVSGNENIFGHLVISDGDTVTNVVSVTSVNQTHDLLIQSDTGAHSVAIKSRSTTPSLRSFRSRGTTAAPLDLNNLDGIFTFTSYSYDEGGATFEPSTSILAFANGAHSAGSVPGLLSFWTTPSGTVTQQLRVVINSAGNLGIGTGFAATEKLHVAGNILSTGSVTAVSGSFSNSLTVSGFPVCINCDVDEIEPALVGANGITIVSGTATTTVQGFYTEFTLASGSLQSQINTKNIDEIEPAIIGANGITITSGTSTTTITGFYNEFTSASGSLQSQINNLDSTYATDAQLVSVSGHLQSQIDAVEGSDVDSVNGLAGAVTIAGTGLVSVTTAGQTITISGINDIEPALVGANGIAIISGTNTTTVLASGTMTLASGIITQSLTVSGVPVRIGPVSLQTAYNESSDGYIVTVPGKPVAVSGLAFGLYNVEALFVEDTLDVGFADVPAVYSAKLSGPLIHYLAKGLSVIPPSFYGATSQGTLTVPTASQEGDISFLLGGFGHDGDAYYQSSAIIGIINKNVTPLSSIVTGRIFLSTTDLTGNQNNVLGVWDQRVGINTGGTAPTVELQVIGSGSFSKDLAVGSALTANTGAFTTLLTISGVPVMHQGITAVTVSGLNLTRGQLNFVGSRAANVGISGHTLTFDAPNSVASINGLLGPVVVTGTGLVNITTAGQLITVSGINDIEPAIVGSNGITVTSGTATTTVAGFYNEFVSASGSLQGQLNNLDAVYATDAQLISVSGHLQSQISAIVADEIEPAITGSNGITITSGTSTTNVAAFYSEFTAASGSLQTQIDTKNIDEIEPALVGVNGITVTSGVATTTLTGFYSEFTSASGSLQTQINNLDSIYATDAQLLSVSGHLQTQIDVVEATDVDSINSLQGDVNIVGRGLSHVSTAGQTITVSGINPAIVGANGIAVISGSGFTTVQASGTMVLASGIFTKTLTVSGIPVGIDTGQFLLTNGSRDMAGNFQPDADNTRTFGTATRRFSQMRTAKLFAVDGGGTHTLSEDGGLIFGSTYGATSVIVNYQQGSLVGGRAYSGGQIRADLNGGGYGYGSMALGFAWKQGSNPVRIVASNHASVAMGYTTGNGTNEILASSYGTFAQGNVKELVGSNTNRIQATAPGCFAQGGISGRNASIDISATAGGAFAQGYAKKSANGGTGTVGIRASAGGSFAQGYITRGGTTGTAYITASQRGSFAQGCGYNAAITAGGRGASAQGYAKNNPITAGGHGAHSVGYAQNAKILADANGAFAFGTTSGTIAIVASGINSAQFFPGVNLQANSMQVGQGGLRFRAHPGTPAPGNIQNGDQWVANGYVYIQSNGISVKIVP